MNINAKGWLILAVALGAWLFAPTVAAAQGFGATLTQLPDEFRDLILAAVTAGVLWLLTKVNLGQFTDALAAVIAPIIVAALERLTGQIPPVFDNLVLSILHLIVLFVSGSIGFYLFVKRARNPRYLLQ